MSSTLNIDHHRKSFWKNGYLHLPGFFSSQVMDHLNQMCLDHFGMDPEWEHSEEFLKKSKTQVVPWFPLREGVEDFQVVDQHPDFKALTEAILGPDWSNLYCMSMFSKKGTNGQAWHQDSPPEDPEKFNLNRLIYTHDITDDIGGEVVIMPKTHNQGAITIGDPFEAMEDQLVLAPKKGDVVFLHGHCWHRVEGIRGEYRVSTNFRAVPPGTPEEITDVAVYRNMRYHFPTNKVIEERVSTPLYGRLS